MSACSDKTLEPGPLTALNPDDFLEPPLEPFATPRAQAFADRTAPFLTTLDVAYDALAFESTLDLFGDVADVAGFSASARAAVDPEALGYLQAAEDGFRVARDKTASLQAWLPPDIQAPPHISLLIFRVTDPAAAPVVGAVITIDQDIGRGRTFVTDANGTALVEIVYLSTTAWTISAPGFADAHGVTTGTDGFPILRVTLGA